MKSVRVLQKTQTKHQKTACLSTSPGSSPRSALHPVLQLQRNLGNRAVQRLIQRESLAGQFSAGLVQAKLTVGAAGDHYEQEADHIANRVLTMPAPVTSQSVQREIAPEENKESLQAKPLATLITPLVQREMIPEEDKDKKPVQAKALMDSGHMRLQREMGAKEEEEKKKPVQAKSSAQALTAPGSFHAGNDLESRLSQNKNEGSPLPDHVRAYMEPRFGADFSAVRVHTDSESAQLNEAVSAQAFTHGQDIYYGAGKTPAISDLTAHELTHVIQQTGGKQPPSGSPASSGTAHRRIQRYTIPSSLPCEDVVDWLNNNSPYSPEWAQTSCTYTFNGKLRISPPDKSGGGVRLTVTGHSGLTVSVSCPIDSPQWSPSPRPKRALEVAAWRSMKASLDAHERQHRAIGQAWRATLQARFRGVNFTVSGTDQADAMSQVQQKVSSLQQQGMADAQAAQDAIDPFTGAVLDCP